MTDAEKIAKAIKRLEELKAQLYGRLGAQWIWDQLHEIQDMLDPEDNHP